ncbi:MAG TPA: DUF935 family protein [Methylomirabilota bacterium]|nr:DUF935 family protein [Methylomirabilota bacterium]
MKLFRALSQAFARSAPGPGGEIGSPMQKIVVGHARDRWMTAAVRDYTPERVEQIIRGAMAGDLQAQWQMFDLMEATWPRLNKNLNELKSAVIALDWQIHAWAAKGAEPSENAQRRARLLDELTWNFEPAPDSDENDFEDTLRDILDAVGKGISVLEIDWQQRRTADGLVWAPRATRWVNPRYYGYPVSGTRLMLRTNEEGVRLPNTGQQAGGPAGAQGGFAEFPPDKFIIAVAKTKSGHPLGGSLLRVLGFWWAASNFTWEWFLNLAQVFGMPIRWANYDPNASQATIDKIEEMLENMGSAAWGAFPAGTTIDLKEAVKSATDNPQAVLLKLADTICDISVLWQTLTTDAGDRGTQALGTVHQGIRADRIMSVAKWAAKILNRQLVPAICRLNYGDTQECPWFQPAAKEAKDEKALADRDKTLLDAGVDLPKAWFYERHSVPMPAEGEEVIAGRAPIMGLPAGRPAGQQAGEDEYSAVRAKSATDQLTERVLEDLTGVQARWLGGVKPIFARLVNLAKDGDVSDAELIEALERAAREMPELFNRLRPEALAAHLERAMGAACVNGAVEGAMRRGPAGQRTSRPSGERGGAPS